MQALNPATNFSCALTDVRRGECGKREPEKASLKDLNTDMTLYFPSWERSLSMDHVQILHKRKLCKREKPWWGQSPKTLRITQTVGCIRIPPLGKWGFLTLFVKGRFLPSIHWVDPHALCVTQVNHEVSTLMVGKGGGNNTDKPEWFWMIITRSCLFLPPSLWPGWQTCLRIQKEKKLRFDICTWFSK